MVRSRLCRCGSKLFRRLFTRSGSAGEAPVVGGAESRGRDREMPMAHVGDMIARAEAATEMRMMVDRMDERVAPRPRMDDAHLAILT